MARRVPSMSSSRLPSAARPAKSSADRPGRGGDRLTLAGAEPGAQAPLQGRSPARAPRGRRAQWASRAEQPAAKASGGPARVEHAVGRSGRAGACARLTADAERRAKRCRPSGASALSARMPAHLAPPRSRSFGHFSRSAAGSATHPRRRLGQRHAGQQAPLRRLAGRTFRRAAGRTGRGCPAARPRRGQPGRAPRSAPGRGWQGPRASPASARRSRRSEVLGRAACTSRRQPGGRAAGAAPAWPDALTPAGPRPRPGPPPTSVPARARRAR